MAHYLYRIYYGNEIVYIGRTSQELPQRLRGHFFNKPTMRKIDLSQTTLVEAVELPTRADMYVYEVFYINKLKPLLNCDDKAKDALTIELPELHWQTVELPLKEKWLKLLNERGILRTENLKLREQLSEKEHAIKNQIRTKQLDEEIGYGLLDDIRERIKDISRELTWH